MIIVVSGLPRSGTSMMMNMLKNGGMNILTDGIRKADEDNLKGYFEYERVKNLKEGETKWLLNAEDKAVKIISFLLKHLPRNHIYKVIFMERTIEEILLSQRKMMKSRGEQDDVPDYEMAEYFSKHLNTVKNWLKNKQNFSVLYVSYNETLENPSKIAQEVKDFLKLDLNIEKMTSTVDKDLYHQRKKE